MQELLIINTVEQAEDSVKRGLVDGKKIVCTHSSVEVYLKEYHKLSCDCLSKLLNIDEIKQMKDYYAGQVDRILAGLDEQYAPIFNQELDVELNYFEPLYSYFGKYHILDLACFSEAIKRMCLKENITCIHYYNLSINDYFNAGTDLGFLLDQYVNHLELSEVICREKNNSLIQKGKKLVNHAKRFSQNPGLVLNRIRSVYSRSKIRHEAKNKKTVAVYGYMYDLEFLREILEKDYDVLHYQFEKYSLDKNKEVHQEWMHVPFNQAEQLFVDLDDNSRLFLKNILEDFNTQSAYLMQEIERVKQTHTEKGISLGIWGNPPIVGSRALIFEYFRSKGVPIIGGQHGGLYGDTIFPWHFDSDYQRCNYFLTYGFTHEDLSRSFPERTCKANIIPMGRYVKTESVSAKKKIDILFPLTNSFSMFRGGMGRFPPDQLTDRQIKILELINSFEHLNVYVKPFMNASYQNTSVLPVLKRLTNLHVIDHLKLDEFLRSYSPKAVIIEHYSTPLLEALHLDTEIFLINDPIHPFEEQALNKLTKRVHYEEDLGRYLENIKLFAAGKLSHRRDDEFFKHYVHKENREENIVQFVRGCIENPLMHREEIEAVVSTK